MCTAALCTVITGFTSGAALVIGSGQVKYIFGVNYPRQNTLQGEWQNLADQCRVSTCGKLCAYWAVDGGLVDLVTDHLKWTSAMFGRCSLLAVLLD